MLSTELQYYGNRLCISYTSLTAITSESSIKRLTKSKARRACRNTEALYYVDELPHNLKIEVYRRNPDYEAIRETKPLLDAIEIDAEAVTFYNTYQITEGRYLDYTKQEEYINNASILIAIKSILNKANTEHKKYGNKPLNKTEFWERAAKAMPRLKDEYKHSLPENPRSLQRKFNTFMAEGYESLITSKFLNKNASKICSEEQESVIIRCLSDHRNWGNEQVAGVYNTIARHMGWPEVKGNTIKDWRKKYDLITAGGRLGEANFYNTKAMQVKRTPPTCPLLYWTLDGWDVELFYQAESRDKKGHRIVTYSNRLTLVVVLDPCEKYPIGYAIGTHENPELIKTALRDAANHTAHLFGERYRTNQIQSDHYALKKMLPYYSIIGNKVTPAKIKNAKAKVIEPYFNYLNRTYCQLQPNWSGFGITTNKSKQPNSDALNILRKSFPTMEQCIMQIVRIMETERANKREAYVSKWANLPESRKLPLSKEQYLLAFGSDTKRPIMLNSAGKGLTPNIMGEVRSYDTFNIKFREYPHVRWSVKYDPSDLSQILAVSEDGSLRFLLDAPHTQPMALAERRAGDAEALAEIWGFNKRLTNYVMNHISLAYDKVEALIAHNPMISTPLVRALICDSRGQHKDRKNQARLGNIDMDKLQVKTIGTTPTVSEQTFTEETPWNTY